MLVPKEMKVETVGRISQLTDEELDQAIEEMLARRSGEAAKVIEGEVEVVPGLPPPLAPETTS